jgi:hypothetical protein
MGFPRNTISGKMRTSRSGGAMLLPFFLVASTLLAAAALGTARTSSSSSSLGDSLSATIERLQSFGSRFSGTARSDSAAFYLRSRLAALGLPARLDTVRYLSGTWKRTFNVVATIGGAGESGEEIVLGAHFDSISRHSYTDSLDPAPGADDNGSGCAAVLELARMLKRFRFERTITFVFFGGEEIGRRGSLDYASRARGRGDLIVVMVCLDGIGYEQGPVWDIEILANQDSRQYADSCAASFRAIASPVVALPYTVPSWIQSDHSSFWDNGYPAIHVFEGRYDGSPFYHTGDDTAGTVNLPFLAQTVEGLAVFMEDLAKMRRPQRIVSLHGAYPNPFANSMTLPYTMNFKSTLAVDVFDVAGRHVRRLFAGTAFPGDDAVIWNGSTQHGARAPSGVYFIRFSTPSTKQSAKVVFLRNGER